MDKEVTKFDDIETEEYEFQNIKALNDYILVK